jgi:predicted phage-related endonuclease
MASEQDFWWCVDTDTPPDTDGSEATTEALATIYADEVSGSMASLFGRESLLAERSQLKSQQKALDERVKEIENRIKADMGEAEKAACGRFSVSWKSQSRRSFQEREFQKDHPDIDLRPYFKTSTSRVFKVTEKEAV